MKKYKCLCCGYQTLETRGEFDICPVCFWEDEPTESELLDMPSEANNGLTLRQGQENYRSFGACKKEMLPYVRKPLTNEKIVTESRHANQELQTRAMLTRIDTVRQYVDAMLKACDDSEVTRCGYVHLYGVGQACALIALRRGHDRAYAELAEIAGMLHDYATYKEDAKGNHAERSSVQAREILTQTGEFTPEETDMICQAISRHSDKKQVHEEMDEILKDADVMQHWLRNPVEEYFFAQPRVQKLIEEFQLGLHLESQN